MRHDPHATPDQYEWIAQQLESLSTALPEVTTPEQRIDAARRAALRAALDLQRALLDFTEVALL